MASAFGPLRALGERQLQIQFTLLGMYDTQAMGILALNGALAAAAIAAKDLIGHLWCLSLIGLLAWSLPCIAALGYVRPRSDEKFGPRIKALIIPAATLREDEMDKAIAIALGDAIADNKHRLRTKRRRVFAAVATLGATITAVVLSVLVSWREYTRAMAQAQDIAVKEPRKQARARKKKAEEAPETIEVKLDGKTLTVTQDTVPTGIFPLPRFLSRFLG